MLDTEDGFRTDKQDMPPARPKPKTSHTWINGVPEQPAPNTTEIREGGRGAWFVPVALVAIVGVLAVLGLKLQAWLLELVGICG